MQAKFLRPYRDWLLCNSNARHYLGPITCACANVALNDSTASIGLLLVAVSRSGAALWFNCHCQMDTGLRTSNTFEIALFHFLTPSMQRVINGFLDRRYQ